MSNFEVKFEDAQVNGLLQRFIDLGRRTGAVMQNIAALGESSTRLRFRTETAPDGQSWKPSLRAQITGGKTLTKDSHLADSVSSSYGSDYAEWGVNRIYAAIHQFGGVIKKDSGTQQVRHRTDAKGELLRSSLFGGRGLIFAKKSHKRVSIREFIVKSHEINMPARPFLGVSEKDKSDILNMLEIRLGLR